MTILGEQAYTQVLDRENGEETVADQQEPNPVVREGNEEDRLTPCAAISPDPENTQPRSIADGPESINEIITVDEAIERLGMGRFQLVVSAAAGLCFAADAMQVMMLTFLSQILRLEWNLTDNETAMISSILFIGAIGGTLTLGPLADKKGRKPVFLLTGSIITCFGAAVAVVSNYEALLGALFMVGWGVGGLTVPFDILAEFLPSKSRGKNLLAVQYFWTLGVMFVVCIAYLTLGNGDQAENWRLFVVICVLPCCLSVVIGYFFVPESPRWLCSQGRCEEAIEIVRHAAKINGHQTEFLYPEGMQLEDEEEEDCDFLELFKPRWRWTTIKLWGTWAFVAFGYYGTLMGITEIFDSHVDSVVEGQNGKNSFDYGAIFISSSAELVGATLVLFFIDSLGRIPVQVASYAFAGISVYFLYVSAAHGAHRSSLIAFGFCARIFEMSGSCTAWIYTAEVLTTEVRTTGHSAANAVGRIGSLCGPFLVSGHISFAKKGLIMLAIHVGSIFFVSQLPETKGRRMGIAQDDISDDDSYGTDVFFDEDVEDASSVETEISGEN
mmetsp:Transcript_14047/g.39350  ORF Transcript_14047/g.39350 Transcript_14047/m.39350 type:complete len:555 (+) Transcript_14047:233-1897(+)